MISSPVLFLNCNKVTFSKIYITVAYKRLCNCIIVGSKINIRVINKLDSTVPAIHWHGLELRHGYYWYDGALGLTECGVGAGQAGF